MRPLAVALLVALPAFAADPPTLDQQIKAVDLSDAEAKLRAEWFVAPLVFPTRLPEGEGSWILVKSTFENAAQANPLLDPIQGEPAYQMPLLTANSTLAPAKNDDNNILSMS